MAKNSEDLHLVGFRVGDLDFATSISNVHEIIRGEEIVKIPKAPVFVDGVINLRGNVICVIDLSSRLDIIKTENQKKKPFIMIVEIAEVMVGLKVDGVSNVFFAEEAQYQNLPGNVMNIDQKFLKGVVKVNGKMIMLLDTNNILTKDESMVLTRAV